MPLFEETLFTITKINKNKNKLMATTCSEHTKSKKMPLFEETPVTTPKPSCIGYYIYRTNYVQVMPLFEERRFY